MTINLFGWDAVFGLGDEAVDDDAEKLDIPIHAFDLIVADECHRGYSSKELSVWRNTLDHFDAVKIGLTATPAAQTTAYFENIVYRYEYERTVREGYLVDYDVVSINSNVRMTGVFLEEGEQVESVDPMSGVKQLDLLEDERSFDTSKIEREITASDSVPVEAGPAQWGLREAAAGPGRGGAQGRGCPRIPKPPLWAAAPLARESRVAVARRRGPGRIAAATQARRSTGVARGPGAADPLVVKVGWNMCSCQDAGDGSPRVGTHGIYDSPNTERERCSLLL